MKIFNTVQDLKEARLTAGQLTETKGYHSAGDGGQARYLIQTSKGVDALSEELSNGNWAVMQSGVLIENITVYIPSDYPTLQAAVDDIHGRIQVKSNVTITLMIESGHQLTNGLLVTNGDYSAFIISSVDPTVFLSSDFVGIGDGGYLSGIDPDGDNSDTKSDNLILGFNAVMPRLNTKIDMQNEYGSGYYGVWGCRGFVAPMCGVINAGANGLEFRNGYCVANRSVWTGATGSGIRAAYTAHIDAQLSNCDYCCKGQPINNNMGAVDISRTSTCHFRQGKARYSFASGANIRRASTFTAEQADFRGAYTTGVEIKMASKASLHGANMSDVVTSTGGQGYGLWVQSASNVSAFAAVIKNNGGESDVRLGTSSPGASSAGVVDLTNAETTGGVNSISDISVANFNVVDRRGVALNFLATGPLDGLLRFSLDGETTGSRFSSGFLQISRNGTSTLPHIRFYNPNGLVGNISTAGSSTSYNTSSDESLKDFNGDLDLDYAISIIKADPVRRFTWKGDGGEDVGWGAQTSYAISKDLATPGGWFNLETGEAAEEGADNAVYIPWSIDQSKRTPYLWAAVSKLVDEVKRLKDELAKLKTL